LLKYKTNKEYWRQRGRMEKPDGLVHAANIRLIWQLIAEEPALVEY
jgi:hypothetical protein